MNQEQPTYDELLLQQQAKAKGAILAECDNLAARGVTFVVVHSTEPATKESLKTLSATAPKSTPTIKARIWRMTLQPARAL